MSAGVLNNNFKHGMCGTSEHRAYFNMITRCSNPNYDHYADYGGRGITVCQEWLDDFEAFYAHVGDKPTPKHSLDRINNDGNYEPGNVKWSTQKEQANNQRIRSTATFITHNVETKTITQWAKITGLSVQLIWQRLNKGMNSADILTPATHDGNLPFQHF